MKCVLAAAMVLFVCTVAVAVAVETPVPAATPAPGLPPIPADMMETIKAALASQATEAIDEEAICRNLGISCPPKPTGLAPAEIERQIEAAVAKAISRELAGDRTALYKAEAEKEIPLHGIGDEVTLDFNRGGHADGKLYDVQPNRVRVGGRWYSAIDLTEDCLATIIPHVHEAAVEKFIQVKKNRENIRKMQIEDEVKKTLEPELYRTHGYVMWKRRWVSQQELYARAMAYYHAQWRKKFATEAIQKLLADAGYTIQDGTWKRQEAAPRTLASLAAEHKAAETKPQADRPPPADAPAKPPKETTEKAPANEAAEAPVFAASDEEDKDKEAAKAVAVKTDASPQKNEPESAVTPTPSKPSDKEATAPEAAKSSPEKKPEQKQKEEAVEPEKREAATDAPAPADVAEVGFDSWAEGPGEKKEAAPPAKAEDKAQGKQLAFQPTGDPDVDKTMAELAKAQQEMGNWEPPKEAKRFGRIVLIALTILVYVITSGITTASFWVGAKLTKVEAGIPACAAAAFASQLVKMLVPGLFIASMGSVAVSYGLLYKWSNANSLTDIIFLVVIGNLVVTALGVVLAMSTFSQFML